MSETDTIYELQAPEEMEDLKDSIFDLAVDLRKKQREAIISYAQRKNKLSHIDGTETRRNSYLEAFGESQKAEIAKDEADLKLSQAIDQWLSKHGGPDV